MLDVFKICRFCLLPINSGIDCIQIGNLKNIIIEVLDIKIKNDDKCSIKICSTCYDHCMNYYKFRKTVKENQKLMHDLCINYEQIYNLNLINIKNEDVIFIETTEEKKKTENNDQHLSEQISQTNRTTSKINGNLKAPLNNPQSVKECMKLTKELSIFIPKLTLEDISSLKEKIRRKYELKDDAKRNKGYITKVYPKARNSKHSLCDVNDITGKPFLPQNGTKISFISDLVIDKVYENKLEQKSLFNSKSNNEDNSSTLNKSIEDVKQIKPLLTTYKLPITSNTVILGNTKAPSTQNISQTSIKQNIYLPYMATNAIPQNQLNRNVDINNIPRPPLSLLKSQSLNGLQPNEITSMELPPRPVLKIKLKKTPVSNVSNSVNTNSLPRIKILSCTELNSKYPLSAPPVHMFESTSQKSIFGNTLQNVGSNNVSSVTLQQTKQKRILSCTLLKTNGLLEFSIKDTQLNEVDYKTLTKDEINDIIASFRPESVYKKLKTSFQQFPLSTKTKNIFGHLYQNNPFE